jgi:hypothetical protein
MLKVTGLDASGGNESTFSSDLLLTARCSRTRVPVVVECLLCYPGNTLLLVPKATRKGQVGVIQIPKFNLMFFFFI